MQTLTQHLADAGLVQFGLFGNDPVRFNLHLLPSYPQVLETISKQICHTELNTSYERILVPADSVSLGVACSLESGVPLVYSRGSNNAPVWDLVGAYDVGHPTLLLLNIGDNPKETRRLIENAGRVGLDVVACVAVIGIWPLDQSGVTESSLLDLLDLVDELLVAKRLPPAQANAVHQWIESRAEIT